MSGGEHVHYMILALLGTLVAPSHSVRGAQDPAVSFPLSVYSYERIAQILSRPDSIVSCGQSLKLHAVLLNLKERTRDEMLAVLSKGLGVQFQKPSGNSHDLTMQPDSELSARNSRFRNELIASLKSSAGALRNRIRQLNLSRELITGDVEPKELSKRVNDAQTLGNDAAALLSSKNPDIAKARNMMLDSRAIEWAAAIGSVPDRRYCFALYENNRSIIDSLKVSPSGGYTSAILRKATGSRDAGPAQEASPYGVRWKVIRYKQRVAMQLQVASFRPQGVSKVVTMSVDYPDVPRDGGQTLMSAAENPNGCAVKGLSDEAARLLSEEIRASRRLLATGMAEKKVHVTWSRRPQSLSEVIQAWDQGSGVELIMELSPIADSLNSDQVVADTISMEFSLADLMQNSENYVVSEQGGISVIKDLFAFIQGDAWPPVAALVQVQSQLHDKPRAIETATVPWELIVQYAKDSALSPSWSETMPNEVSRYRGAMLNELDAYSFFGGLNEALPDFRAAVPLASKGRTSIKVTEVHLAALRNLTPMLLSHIPVLSMSDDPARFLLNGTITLESKESQELGGLKLLQLLFDPAISIWPINPVMRRSLSTAVR